MLWWKGITINHCLNFQPWVFFIQHFKNNNSLDFEMLNKGLKVVHSSVVGIFDP
jgi:hypothetical protein